MVAGRPITTAEYDGVAWHSGPDAFFRDRRR